MRKAVVILDGFMQEKTVHSTKAILDVMRSTSAVNGLFTSRDAQQDFAQRCRNFEIYNEQSGRTSWGRKEFERWWNDPHPPSEVRMTIGGNPVGKVQSLIPQDPPTDDRSELEIANERIRQLEAELHDIRGALSHIYSTSGHSLGWLL